MGEIINEAVNGIKVSVIIPIYNMSKYLNRSIESVKNQTLKDIEIILVNDGSTDDSLDICREYEKIDKRIKVIDKSNGGVSSARNAGIETAIGEYIGFVDPDDWIESEMYENMYGQAKELETDVNICNYRIENNEQSIPIVLDIRKEILNRNEIIYNLIANMISSNDLNSNAQVIMGSVCWLIISKELIDKYKFRFIENINFMEDLIFSIQVLLKSNKVSLNEGIYYHYMTNLNSAVSCYREDFIDIEKQVFKIIENILKEENIYNILVERMNVRYVGVRINLIANELHKENKKKVSEKIKKINTLCKDKRVKEILKTIDTKEYTIRKRTVLTGIKYEFGLFLYIYYFILVRIYLTR
ncbi:glycosyltransferase [Clostridium sp. SHJSY1]|uniref:glycosyltransferase n=1 Tax=Clostridium sp. SHJSY1 TaxID=2942483 RepID=UPI0028749E83|nr:glycosyltransferase [Clostridium sp. SHJSY1]MDS0526537.1 glycosyltransferase [Clostridium sp. SHJSY1]